MNADSATGRADGGADDVFVRDRRPGDLEALVGIAERVRALDGYPVYLRDGGLRRFLTQPSSLDAWAAERDGTLVGHVVLNAQTSAPVMQLVAQRDHDREAAFVARRAATAQALVPILDVVTTGSSTPAIALYRSAGWREIGRTSFGVDDGQELKELVFEGPGA